jgi:hypothetical protein
MSLSGSLNTTLFGRNGEGLVRCFLMSKGRIIVEVGALGDKGLYGHHAPSLYVPKGGGYRLTAPDLLTINPFVTPSLWSRDNIWEFPFLWTEVKHKNTATFYRKWNNWEGRWQTGIDRRLYPHYCQIDKDTQIPVWLLFLQRNDGPSNAPPGKPPCPTGLFGCPITQPYSDDWKNDTYEKKGYQDMVYWGIEDLLQLATLEEVLAVSKEVVPA